MSLPIDEQILKSPQNIMSLGQVAAENLEEIIQCG